MTDINGFSGEQITINGLITDDFTQSIIDLQNNNILLSGDLLSFNNEEVLVESDLDTLNHKTQNIESVAGTTTVTGILNVVSGQIEGRAITNDVNEVDQILSDSSYGFTFNTTKEIQISKIGIHTNQWPSSSSLSIVVNVYNLSQVLIASYNIDQSTIFENHYISNISLLLLQPGIYTISYGMIAGMKKNITQSILAPPLQYRLIDESGSYLSVFSQTPGGIYANLSSISGTGNIWYSYSQESLLNVNKLNVNQINSLTPSGGVFMLTSDCNLITATGFNQNLFASGSFVGTLTIPANTFEISSYKLFVSGIITGQNNGLISFNLNSGSLVLGTILTQLIAVTNQSFTLTAYFSIRNIGSVATVITSFNFNYSNGTSNFQGDNNLNIQNEFDTTINNTLSVLVNINQGTTTTIRALQAIIKQIY